MRQRQIIGALQMLCGLGLWALGLALGLVWLGFCIATIVVGVLVYPSSTPKCRFRIFGEAASM